MALLLARLGVGNRNTFGMVEGLDVVEEFSAGCESLVADGAFMLGFSDVRRVSTGLYTLEHIG